MLINSFFFEIKTVLFLAIKSDYIKKVLLYKLYFLWFDDYAID